MGNIWQVIYREYICEACNKSAILGSHPTMGPWYSDTCPFCGKPLIVKVLPFTIEEKIKFTKDSLHAAKAGVATNDLSKLLQDRN